MSRRKCPRRKCPTRKKQSSKVEALRQQLCAWRATGPSVEWSECRKSQCRMEAAHKMKELGSRGGGKTVFWHFGWGQLAHGIALCMVDRSKDGAREALHCV
uniref:Uncharacterized protein n=1 Tax=Globodera rostochiensis TaxID=31243 RepID=A0A914ICL5_GLORO